MSQSNRYMIKIKGEYIEDAHVGVYIYVLTWYLHVGGVHVEVMLLVYAS